MTQQPDIWSYWLDKLSKLNQGNDNAPHKPLLLLVVCDLFEQNRVSGALVKRDGDLTFRFHSYWKVVATRRSSRPDVKLPFFHLRRDGIWKPLENNGREAKDRIRATLAQMEPSLYLAFKETEFGKQVRRTLIARYFETSERAELYSLLSIEIPPRDIVAADASRYLLSETKEAKRDAKFSLRVLPAYDYTCALYKFRMIGVDGSTPLDAAHIHQFKRGGSNHPTNGLALSKTAHWLFDRGFWSIKDDYSVIVNEAKFEESGEHLYLLKPRSGSQILIPSNSYFHPSADCLRWHRNHHSLG